MGADPVEAGLVASLSRPGGNLTGFYNLYAAVAAKRLDLLHEAVPGVTLIAYLKNPTDKVITEPETKELEVAARILGVRLLFLNASDQSEIEAVFTTLVNEGAGALLVGGGNYFSPTSINLSRWQPTIGCPRCTTAARPRQWAGS
jgi:putative tryptophan/tyrosine transport system substrate-binding protein